MTKILFVVRGYAPEVSASGNLIRSIVETASEDKSIEVSVLCISGKGREEYINGVKIIRVSAQDRFDKYSIMNKINRQININYHDKKIVSVLRTKIEKLDSEESYDAIISASYEEALALTIAEIDNVKKYHFQLEKFPISTSLKLPLIYNKKIKNKESIEKKVLNTMNKVFCLPIVFDYYQEKKYPNIIKVEHPMIVEIKRAFKSNSSKPRLIYGGGLDRIQRNPIKLLQLLSKVNDKLPIKIDFYSYSNMNKELSDFERNNKFFKSNAPVTKEEYLKEMMMSNIVLTIGNKENDIFPSKLFDCISTGLPIIHISQNSEDVYYQYLKKYRNYLILNIDELMDSNTINRVLEFIVSNTDKKLEFKEIAENYEECTPDYVWNQFIREIRN